jgi:hypothetical protein
MKADPIARKFEQIGARFVHRHRAPQHWEPGLRVDVTRDRRGELFEIVSTPDSDLALWVPDVQPSTRHLVLHSAQSHPTTERHVFLCGFDERHLFVAGIEGEIASVRQAFEALKPPAVIAALSAHQVKAKDRDRRANAAVKRQGEWFFLPAPDFVTKGALVFRHEPLRLGRRKLHVAEELARRGGMGVRVSHRYPNGLTEGEYLRLLGEDPEIAALHWWRMTRDAEVFVRGAIRHPDHRTLHLTGWHRVLPNREAASNSLAFLD